MYYDSFSKLGNSGKETRQSLKNVRPAENRAPTLSLFPPIAGLLSRRRRLDHGHLHPDHLIVEVVDVLLQLGHFGRVLRLHLLQLGL